MKYQGIKTVKQRHWRQCPTSRWPHRVGGFTGEDQPPFFSSHLSAKYFRTDKYIHPNTSESCIFWKTWKSFPWAASSPFIAGMVVLGASEDRDLRAAWKEYTRKVFPHAFTQIRNFLLVSISEGRSFDDVDRTLVSESGKSARNMYLFVIGIKPTYCED